jgi:hypothetical protein
MSVAVINLEAVNESRLGFSSRAASTKVRLSGDSLQFVTCGSMRTGIASFEPIVIVAFICVPSNALH